MTRSEVTAMLSTGSQMGGFCLDFARGGSVNNWGYLQTLNFTCIVVSVYAMHVTAMFTFEEVFTALH